jgi:hypothetical protein
MTHTPEATFFLGAFLFLEYRLLGFASGVSSAIALLRLIKNFHGFLAMNKGRKMSQ